MSDDEFFDDRKKDKKDKKKKNEKKDEDNNNIPPFNFKNMPFGLPGFNFKNKKEQDAFNKQFQDFIKNFGDVISKNMQNMDFNQMFKDIMEKMNMDPSKIPNMGDLNSEEFQKMLRENMAKFGMQGPFVFGMNMKMGPDGKPIFEPINNVNSNQDKENSKVELDENVINAETREPLTDISEEDDHIIVVCEIPGVDKHDIELKATENTLTIIASASDLKRKFKTTVDLPCSINPDHAKARYQNGILEVKLEKTEDKSGKRISID